MVFVFSTLERGGLIVEGPLWLTVYMYLCFVFVFCIFVFVFIINNVCVFSTLGKLQMERGLDMWRVPYGSLARGQPSLSPLST